MTKFRACIDLHDGKVKQIIGSTLPNPYTLNELKIEGLSTLIEVGTEGLSTNYTSPHSASYYASLYNKNQLTGTHIIKLGPGNDEVARDALQMFPDTLQLGGQITLANCAYWINEARASHVILTSYLIPDMFVDMERLRKVVECVGKKKIVIDLSCKKVAYEWIVASQGWAKLTNVKVNEETISLLSDYCDEFLVHAADVEGLCRGIDSDLVEKLGEWSTIPCTYAGGANSVDNLDQVKILSKGKVDLTFGSALDIFGGSLVKFEEVVAWNMRQ